MTTKPSRVTLSSFLKDDGPDLQTKPQPVLCREPGCNNEAVPGAVYCQEHLEGRVVDRDQQVRTPTNDTPNVTSAEEETGVIPQTVMLDPRRAVQDQVVAAASSSEEQYPPLPYTPDMVKMRSMSRKRSTVMFRPFRSDVFERILVELDLLTGVEFSRNDLLNAAVNVLYDILELIPHAREKFYVAFRNHLNENEHLLVDSKQAREFFEKFVLTEIKKLIQG